jgi:hypothetical protein
MPLQNRCDPFGTLHAVAARGTMMGNRGGRIHDPATKTLTRRRWASKAWISCVTSFRGRQHDVWGQTYTALFFVDEVTAFASGHRPCFECRNADAKRFATLWAQTLGRSEPMKAAEMDECLHRERMASGRQPLPHLSAEDVAALPDGSMVALDSQPFAVRAGRLLPWSFAGYGAQERLSVRQAQLITPPSIVAVLSRGYEPRWGGGAL